MMLSKVSMNLVLLALPSCGPLREESVLMFLATVFDYVLIAITSPAFIQILFKCVRERDSQNNLRDSTILHFLV